MSHCTTHSFKIICRGWNVGLADLMMHSVRINSTAIRYTVSYKYNPCYTASGIRHFGSVVRALNFYPSDPDSNLIRDVRASFLSYEFLYS